jgi:hypothetical protein
MANKTRPQTRFLLDGTDNLIDAGMLGDVALA